LQKPLVPHINWFPRGSGVNILKIDSCFRFRVAFRNSLIWILVASGNFFMTAIAAFNKTSRNYKVFSKEQFKKVFF
jgi:hypothetical protein